MTRTRARSCEGKKGHASKLDAEAHRQRKIKQGAFYASLIVYRCRHCKKWHVGHPLGSNSIKRTNANRGGSVSR